MARVTIDLVFATRFRFSCRRAVVLPARLAWLRFWRRACLQRDDVIDVCGSHSSPPGRAPIDGVRRWLIRVHGTVYGVSDREEKPAPG
jgi:hypothetical protein